MPGIFYFPINSLLYHYSLSTSILNFSWVCITIDVHSHCSHLKSTISEVLKSPGLLSTFLFIDNISQTVLLNRAGKSTIHFQMLTEDPPKKLCSYARGSAEC